MPTSQGPLDSLIAIFSSLPLETQVFITIISLACVCFHLFFSQRTANYGPTVLTTMGIFATFIAIANGLTAFDAADVQKSVPSLLDALKTAFWASVVGVGGALTLKLRDFFSGHRQLDDAASGSGDVTAADIARHLKDIQLALAGNEDGSLISQIKLTRQDTNDRLDALKAAQLEALKKISEVSSKTLVEALRDVIRDFNQNLTEQFGDNFKELNSAVGQLLVWQEQYRDFVETTSKQLDEVVQLTHSATNDYADLVTKAGTFSVVANDLSTLLTTLHAEEERLKIVSEGLAKVLREASGNLPEIERKVVELTTQLAGAVAQTQEKLSSALTESAKQMNDTISKNQTDVSKALTESSSKLGVSITENQRTLSKTLEETAQQMAEVVNQNHKTTSQVLVDSAAQTTALMEKSKEQIAALDRALSEELTKSLEGLGRQLTALSNRFVEDYGPLTEKLRKVVELGSVR